MVYPKYKGNSTEISALIVINIYSFSFDFLRLVYPKQNRWQEKSKETHLSRKKGQNDADKPYLRRTYIAQYSTQMALGWCGAKHLRRMYYGIRRK